MRGIKSLINASTSIKQLLPDEPTSLSTIMETHDKEFEEAADRVIEVEKINGVSVVR